MANVVACAAVAAGPPLGRLDQAVDGLQDAVADTRLEPVEDALPVPDQGVGEDLHRLDRHGALPDAQTPVGQEGVGLVGAARQLPELLELELELVRPAHRPATAPMLIQLRALLVS